MAACSRAFSSAVLLELDAEPLQNAPRPAEPNPPFVVAPRGHTSSGAGVTKSLAASASEDATAVRKFNCLACRWFRCAYRRIPEQLVDLGLGTFAKVNKSGHEA